VWKGTKLQSVNKVFGKMNFDSDVNMLDANDNDDSSSCPSDPNDTDNSAGTSGGTK